MRGRMWILLLAPLVATFIGCGDGGERHAEVAETGQAGTSESAVEAEVGTVEALEAPVVAPSPTLGGDGSQIALLAVTEAQLGTVDLPGELACTFEAPVQGTLLVARADVLPDGAVHAVLNNNGYTEMLANGQAGGFNDLVDGVVLTGRGLTVRLVRGADQPTGDETTRHAATLTVQRADGAERTYDGTWTCGP